MIETQPNLAASSCGAPAIPAAGVTSTAGASAVAAVRITDVLVTTLDPTALAGMLGLAQAGAASTGRPDRPRPATGYADAAVPVAPPRTAAASAKTTSTTSSAASKTSGPLGFLNDSKMSVEDKLFKFMCYVADKYDKAIEKKLNEIANKQSSTTKKSSGGGLLGGIAGAGKGLLGGLLGGGGGDGGLSGILGSVFPAAGVALDVLKSSGVQKLVTQLSGPVLAAGATCLGFPEFAPVLLKAGPELAKGAFGLLDSATGSSSTSASSSSSSSSADGDPKIEQKDMLELQRLQDKQKEMFSLISNMLQSMHDTKMAVINNVRT